MDQTFFLFVQTFGAGTLAPHATDPDRFTQTLTGATAQTVFFSDRPECIVGTTPTVRFLDALGFTPDNPPNAALVAQTETGEDVVVLELFDPVYSEAFGADGTITLTYEVRLLAEYDGTGLAHLATKQDDAQPPEVFGAASLFIDDCHDRQVTCVSRGGVNLGDIGNQGFCWDGTQNCRPCRDYAPLCIEQYGDAGLGYCSTDYYCPTPCW